MANWRMRSGLDRRFKSGHPWVYSNELQDSPKGIAAGEPVDLHDAGGAFLARGYGNAASLIAFRAVGRSSDEAQPLSVEGMVTRLWAARETREQLGLSPYSYRWVFGEADHLPGLVIDRYKLGKGPGQVLVVQAHTAGMDRVLPALETALKQITKNEWANTTLVLRNDVGIRKLEGLAEEAPRVLHLAENAGEGETWLNSVGILVRSATDLNASVEFRCDLLAGQKTGFFLDQSANVRLAADRLTPWAKSEFKRLGRPIRVLDLFCYVGQWSTQLAQSFKAAGVKAEFTVVDASASALEFARSNVQRSAMQVRAMKADILAGIPEFVFDRLDDGFDIVIADPPALIKGRKDLPTGTQAYAKLNALAMGWLRPGGAVVTCSCSALLDEESFERAISKGAHRSGRSVRWVGQGSQGPDHPVRLEFPEGRYLKAWIGITETYVKPPRTTHESEEEGRAKNQKASGSEKGKGQESGAGKQGHPNQTGQAKSSFKSSVKGAGQVGGKADGPAAGEPRRKKPRPQGGQNKVKR